MARPSKTAGPELGSSKATKAKRLKTLLAGLERPDPVPDDPAATACHVLAHWLATQTDQSPLGLRAANADHASPTVSPDPETLVQLVGLLGCLLRAHLAHQELIASLLRRVLDADSAVRRQARRQVYALAPSHVLPHARAVLVPLLLQTKSNPRRSAVNVIRRLCHSFTPTPPYLLSALVKVLPKRQDADLPVWSATTLQELAPPSFIRTRLKQIVACLGDDLGNTPRLCSLLLTQTTEALTPHADRIVTNLMAALRAQAGCLCQIAHLLISLLGRLPKALVTPHLAELIQRLSYPHEKAGLLGVWMPAMTPQVMGPQIMRTLIPLLADARAETRDGTRELLKLLPEKVLAPHLPEVIELLRAPQRYARASAQTLLKVLARDEPAALLPFLDTLVGMAVDTTTRPNRAARVLAAFRPGDLSRHLAPLFGPLRPARSHEPAPTCAAKLAALQTLHLLDPVLVKPHAKHLPRHLQDPDQTVQLWTVKLMMRAGALTPAQLQTHLGPILQVCRLSPVGGVGVKRHRGGPEADVSKVVCVCVCVSRPP